MAPRFGLNRTEKLKSRKDIEALFLGGRNFSEFPLRVVYQVHSGGKGGVKLAVSVGKRHFKNAVQRNRIKRLLREAFRLHKSALVMHAEENRQDVHMFLLYQGKHVPVYSEIETAVVAVIKRLKKVLPHEKDQ